MPDFQGDQLYKTREEILAALIANMQELIPDVWVGEDGNLRILFEVEAGQIEGLYLANQIVLNDMFIQTAGVTALERHGNQIGLAFKAGVKATGELLFSGAGGTLVPISSQVSTDPNVNDPLYYLTIASGNIPNPGIPDAPTIEDEGTAGNPDGLFIYAITFVTDEGETTLGIQSDSLSVDTNKIDITDIPLGGAGTIARKIYRSKNGGPFLFVDEIANNSATTYTDNIADGSLGGEPPDVSTAERIRLPAEAELSGDEYNASAGTINQLADVPDGISTVTNPDPFVDGVDPEDYEKYRIRLLDFIRNPQTGSKGDLEVWAEAVDGVDTATCFPNDDLGTPTDGHATVRISGPNGTVPSSEVVDAVLAELEAKDIANITLHVGTFTPVPVDVTVVITLEPNYLLSEVEDEVVAAVEAYLNSVPVGGTAYIAGIIDAVFGNVTGVATLEVSDPVSDTGSTATEKVVAGTVTVS